MKNNTYQPNFTNKAFLKRAVQALSFVETYVSTTKPGWLSSRYIDQHFGQSQHAVSQYLRKTLLICVDHSYSKENRQCKKYVANKQGVSFLRSMVSDNRQTQYSVYLLGDKHQQQLQSGNFEYNDSSSRLYHPIQNIRRDIKQKLLARYSYEHTYDIVCSCPTLILEYIKQLGSEEYPNAIKTYIDNRQSIRSRIAQQCELSEQQVKRIINGLFQGAHISNYTESLIYREVDGDSARIAWLKQDQFLCDLRADIKMCWSIIKQTQPRRTQIDKNGRVRSMPLSGRRKTAIYRDLERRVLDQVRIYLLENNDKFFLEHDGWSCAREIDREKLIEFVREQTGFKIEIDYEFVGKNKATNTI